MKKENNFLKHFEEFLAQHFAERKAHLPTEAVILFDSATYSLFSGGKRFRPMLSGLVADALKCQHKKIFAFAAAVELVHSYSLIHDDLPCMDNDDVRRGQPTNHIKYGEATALLAGDVLLTEAFYIIGHYYEQTPEVGLKLTRLLSEAAGLAGMVAGQIIDINLNAKNSDISQDQLLQMHRLKTGALIRVSAEGAAVIAQVSAEKKSAITKFGGELGLAFQLADDILDYDPKDLEASGFPKLIGIESTKNLLSTVTENALMSIKGFGADAQGLRELVEFNFSRNK